MDWRRNRRIGNRRINFEKSIFLSIAISNIPFSLNACEELSRIILGFTTSGALHMVINDYRSFEEEESKEKCRSGIIVGNEGPVEFSGGRSQGIIG